jgi:hypothetical protein
MNTYCVILGLQPLVNFICYPRTKRFYLRAATADGAIQKPHQTTIHRDFPQRMTQTNRGIGYNLHVRKRLFPNAHRSCPYALRL